VPTKNSSIVELSRPDYVPVTKASTTYYGGSQMWFSKNHWYSKDYILHHYGCGVIATADMLLYLALQKEALQTPATDIILKGHSEMEYTDYLSFVHHINKQYTKVRRIIAVLGPTVASAINAYADKYGLRYQASWKWKLTYYDMYELIEEMLRKDIPVILSIGPNTPILWGKKGIPFYERCEIDYQEDTEKPSGAPKPYYYKPVQQNINGHYVTVTGLIKDEVAERIMLRISSWGKKYYINYEEYRDYIENTSGTFTSSMVHVRRV